jgi:hypothetical protein
MKTDHDIENLLMSGKKFRLDETEKATVKSMLLEHAKDSIRDERTFVPSPWSSWAVRSSLSFASLLIIFVGTAYASYDSLPGEPLYVMKVHVVEEMVALTKVSPDEKVAYDTALMEKRLTELQQLIEIEKAPEPEVLKVVADQIDDHIAHATEVLETSKENELPHESKIDVLTKLSGITKAQSKIAKQEKILAPIVSSLEETDVVASENLVSTVEEFVTEGTPEEVNSYLSEQITDVGEQIQASTTDETVRDTAERHLNDVNEALIDGDTGEALLSILEAQEVIDVDVYLEESLETFEQEITGDVVQ